jgi:predicted nucleic acid-binding protein
MARAKKRPAKPAIGFVLDNSIVMAWSFADEVSDYADAVLDRLTTVRTVVPMLWPLEVANALLMGERRKRSTEAETIRWIGILNRLPIVIDDETNTRAWSDTLALARGHKLSAYDAAYLELAVRRKLPLATLDDPLKAAAAAVGVTLYDPAGK